MPKGVPGSGPRSDPDRHRITVHLDDAQYEKLKAIAEYEDRPVNHQARRIFKMALARHDDQGREIEGSLPFE